MYVLGSRTVTSTGSTVTVSYILKSAMNIVNGQWSLSYDTSKLRLKTAASSLMPHITGSTNIYNNVAYGAFSDITNMYDFKNARTFVKAEFEVIGKGTANVNLDVQELSVGYSSGGKVMFENAVQNSSKRDLSSVSGFSSNSISGSVTVANSSTTPTTVPATTAPATNKLTVNATSNFFPTATTTVDKTGTKLTVEYRFKSNIDLLNSQWILTYDTSKLSYNKTATGKIMPNADGVVANESTKGTIKGSNSSTSANSFSTEAAFVRVTFDVLALGTAKVNLNVQILGLVNSSNKEGYLVEGSTVKNLKSVSGFTNLSYATNTKFTTSTSKVVTIKTTSNFSHSGS